MSNATTLYTAIGVNSFALSQKVTVAVALNSFEGYNFIGLHFVASNSFEGFIDSRRLHY